MGRPKGTKNVMRSPEEKESIVLEALDRGVRQTASAHGVTRRLLQAWMKKYQESGIGGLRSSTGRSEAGRPKRPKSREEELELENLRLKIEVARLKKGYLVKGGGRGKEYVTTKGSSTKS